jgi:hypothetical protein
MGKAKATKDNQDINIREAQKYAAYLRPGVRLSEATAGQLRAAIAKGKSAERDR